MELNAYAKLAGLLLAGVGIEVIRRALFEFERLRSSAPR